VKGTSALLAACALIAADSSLDRAYTELRAKNYDAAIALFREGLRVEPARTGPRKDLAYTLLKTGETEQARDEFVRVMRDDPADTHVALEFAFLAYETRQPVEARHVFDRLRRAGNPTAEQAFQNIERPLADGSARWQRALAQEPNNFSGHEELAKLAALREDNELAAVHFLKAWQLKPAYRQLLVDLGRAYQGLGRAEDATAALLAASRGAEPRTAELARELLPARYPYVYEFQKALALDPANHELRRELAYLHLQMDAKADAELHFAQIVRSQPDDLLSTAQLGFLKLGRKDNAAAMPLLDRVLKGDDDDLADRVRVALKLPQTLRRRPETPRAEVTVAAKTLAMRSYEKGYLKDALKYLTIAHESDPLDFEVMLKLGWTNNILKNDGEAARWFNLARRAPDDTIAREASRAFKNIAAAHEPVSTTFWILPMFSSRWQNAFAYSQLKSEIRIASMPLLKPYFSARLLGDARGIERSHATTGNPQYLSESSTIVGVGLATVPISGVSAWFEAGTAMSYLSRRDTARVQPDFRGGLIVTRFYGAPLGASATGRFFETTNDAVFVSRFANDLLLVSQNRIGKTVHPNLQLFTSLNFTVDARREYWANFGEAGGGLRTRWTGLPSNVHFTLQVLRGAHFINRFNPRRPNYFDVRAGFWYAITR